MLVHIIRKANLAICDAGEKLGPWRRHLHRQHLRDVIHEIGGGPNNKMRLVGTNIMKQLQSHIAAIGDRGDASFYHLAEYLAFRGIGLRAQKLDRDHAIEFESQMELEGLALLLIHSPRHRDEGRKHGAIDAAKPPQRLDFRNLQKAHLCQEGIKDGAIGVGTLAVKGFGIHGL